MKKLNVLCAATAAFALFAATAQTEERITTITSTGVVSELAPDALVVTTDNAPVRYSFTKTTKYVDETGNPVAVEIVKSGVPVTVHYTKTASGPVASKVIVRKTTAPGARTTTTTTTTTKPLEAIGTVTDLGDDVIAVRAETGAPARYSFTKTTEYVDEDGNVVSAKTIKTGAPVTVYYRNSGERMEVSKVIVRKTTTTVK